MNELGLGWKNFKRLKQLDNIRPLHGKSKLRGNNNLYCSKIFNDSVYHRNLTFGLRDFRNTRLTGFFNHKLV